MPIYDGKGMKLLLLGSCGPNKITLIHRPLGVQYTTSPQLLIHLHSHPARRSSLARQPDTSIDPSQATHTLCYCVPRCTLFKILLCECPIDTGERERERKKK